MATDGRVTDVSRWPWVAAAVGVIFALMLLVPCGGEEDPSEPGTTDGARVESLVPKGPLSRDACRLHWTAGPPGSTYRLTVLTEELRTLAIWEDLETPEHVIPRGVLQPIEGGTFVWRVEVSLPGSDVQWSGTFHGELDD